jgi:hypothetical protein
MDRVQLVEFYDPRSGEILVKLRVGGFLLGVFPSKSEASQFANSSEAKTLIAKSRDLVAESAWLKAAEDDPEDVPVS